MYVARTQESILNELQTWSELEESRVEGTFSNDVFATNAIEFQKFSLELEELYNAAFGHTTWGEYLDYRAAEHGVYRRAATNAKGEVTCSGTGTVKAGTIFATSNNVRFIAVSDTEIVSAGNVDIEAVIAGDSGNVAAGTINKIPLNVVGIRAVTNANPTVDGYDEENDETLRDRYLLRVHYPDTSGNPQFLINRALEISGVGAASCVRCWQGAGTALILIVDANLETADDFLIERVQKYVDETRPIGCIATVQSAVPTIINISVTTLDNLDADKLKSDITIYFKKLIQSRFIDYTAVDSYEQATEVPAGMVSRAAIGALIESQCEYNYDTLKLNGNFADIPLTVSQIPQLGEISITINIRGQ